MWIEPEGNFGKRTCKLRLTDFMNLCHYLQWRLFHSLMNLAVRKGFVVFKTDFPFLNSIPLLLVKHCEQH